MGDSSKSMAHLPLYMIYFYVIQANSGWDVLCSSNNIDKFDEYNFFPDLALEKILNDEEIANVEAA